MKHHIITDVNGDYTVVESGYGVVCVGKWFYVAEWYACALVEFSIERPKQVERLKQALARFLVDGERENGVVYISDRGIMRVFKEVENEEALYNYLVRVAAAILLS